MKKLFYLLTILLTVQVTAQATKTYNTRVKYKVTPNLSVVDSILTKDSNDLLSATSVADFVSQIGLGNYLQNVVEDLTPQLGGDLDMNSSDIVGVGSINIAGNITNTATLQTANVSASNNVTFANYTNTRDDGVSVNFLHTDNSGNLLSSPVSSIIPVYQAGTNITIDNTDPLLPIINSSGGGSTPTGLEKITEIGSTGWRLVEQDPINYSNIGNNAVDLSISNTVSASRGASGQYSFSAGFETYSSNLGTVAMGYQTTASGFNSTSIGFDNTASGTSSLALGRESNATASFSVAIGTLATASGNSSHAQGNSTIASGAGSTAQGANTTASGNYSFTSGQFTTAFSWNETALGINNTHYTPNSVNNYNISDRLFIIGNGDGINAGNRSDAFTILKDSQVGIDIDNFESNTTGEKLQVNGKVKASDLRLTTLPTYADDTAAGVGGLVAGDVYKTATGELRIKL